MVAFRILIHRTFTLHHCQKVCVALNYGHCRKRSLDNTAVEMSYQGGRPSSSEGTAVYASIDENLDLLAGIRERRDIHVPPPLPQRPLLLPNPQLPVLFVSTLSEQALPSCSTHVQVAGSQQPGSCQDAENDQTIPDQCHPMPQIQLGPGGFSPVTTYSVEPQSTEPKPEPSGFSPVTTYSAEPKNTETEPSGYSPVTTYSPEPQTEGSAPENVDI